ncbi:MAG: T9SS type A sorting domain-containing protein [Saprospiraceae bacterium]
MKKNTIVLSIFLFLINSILVAQTIELNEQIGQYTEIRKIHLVKDNRWLVGGEINELDNSSVYFSVIDTSELIKSDLFLDGYKIKKIRVKDDVGFAWLINENNGNNGLVGIKVDSNSLTLTNQVEIGSNEVINEIEILPNGKLIIVGSKIINFEQRAFFKILNNNFTTVFEDYLTTGYYDDALTYSGDLSFVLLGKLGDDLVYGAKKYNWNYQEQGDIIELEKPDEIFTNEDKYFKLKGQTFSKLNSIFQIENSINLESYGEIIDIEIKDEDIFFLFQEEEAPMILKINHDLEVVNFFAVEDEYFRANDIHISENEIGIGGYLIPNIPFNNTPFLYPSTSGYFKTFSKNGITQDENIELEIIDVKIEDYEKKYTCGPAGLTDVYLLNLKKVKVSLVNRGITTINNVSLFTQAKGIKNCVSSSFNPEYYLQRDDIKMLNLDPGDTVHWRISALEFPQRTIDSTSVELCVWHTSVENQRDQNYDNNYFCGAVELERPFEEFPIIKPREEEVLIYPNPLNDVMTVSLQEAPFEPTVVEFSDFLGRKLEQKFIIAPRAKYKEFDISQISSGFYFIFITNDLISKGVLVYVN